LQTRDVTHNEDMASRAWHKEKERNVGRLNAASSHHPNSPLPSKL